MSNDDNPWTDDRGRQDTLFGEESDAARTMDRSGETVTGSEAFVDDRDAGGTDTGEQAGLFEQTEKLEEQAALGGGTAERTESEGFFTGDSAEAAASPEIVREIGDERVYADAIADETGSEATLAGTGLAPSDFTDEFAEFDRSPVPDPGEERPPDPISEAFGGGGTESESGEFVGLTDRGTEEIIDTREMGGEFFPMRQERDPETGDIVEQETLDESALAADDALQTARQEFAGSARGEQQPASADGGVALELPQEDATNAGKVVARMGERGIIDDDLDAGLLRDAREKLTDAEDGGGTLTLTDAELSELNDAVAGFGADMSPSQRPAGFDRLEEELFGLDTGGSTGGAQADASSSNSTADTREFDFGSRDIAQSVRETVPDGALTGTYDGRHTSIEVDTSKLSQRQLDRLAGEAADATAYEDEKAGQVPLTDSERQRLDFTETTVIEARAAKGIFSSQGVDDWLSWFDPDLTVDEQRDIATRASREDQGKRTDFAEDTSRQQMARAFRAERENLREHAIKGARQGDEEAVRTLIDEVGMSEERARGFVEDTETADEREEMVRTAIVRSKANGRFNREEVTQAPDSPGLRGGGNGRYIGDDYVRADPDAPIMRDPQTGEFMVKQ